MRLKRGTLTFPHKREGAKFQSEHWTFIRHPVRKRITKSAGKPLELLIVISISTFLKGEFLKNTCRNAYWTKMKNASILVFAACIVAVLSSAEEEPTVDKTSDIFTQTYPFAKRAFFYYPAGAGGYFNRPAQSPVDLPGNPYEGDVTTTQDMIRPAYFVPASDLLTMPYPSKSEQEADEEAAMKHLEMLKELHDQLENSEQRFLLPSISMMGNGVNIPTANFLALLTRLSKTVTKVVTTFITVTTNCPISSTSIAEETTTTAAPDVQPSVQPVVLETAEEPISTTTATVTPPLETTTSVPVEMTTTTTPLATITTSTPVIMVTTITSTIV